MRTHLVQRHLRRGQKSLLITSCWPGEGKTTVAINLAAALCEFGLRTLLIDADLRSRRLTRLLLPADSGGDSPLPTDWMAGPMILGASTPTKLPPYEVLTRPDYIANITNHSQGFQALLTDSPALSTCSDAHLTHPWVDGAVIVVSRARFQGVPEGNLIEDLRDHGIDAMGTLLTEI